MQLFQILEQEEFVHSVKDSSYFLPFPSLEDSKNLKQSLSTPPEQQGHGPGSWSQRCPPCETGRVAEDPKGETWSLL